MKIKLDNGAYTPVRAHETDRDNRRKFLIDAYTNSSSYRTKKFGQV